MSRHLLATVAVVSTLPVGALAQDAPVELDEILVQDTVVDTTAGPVRGFQALTSDTATGTRTPLQEIPQSVTVIPRSVIESQQDRELSDVLRNVGGVQPNDTRSTPAFDSTLVRGFSAEQFLDGLTLYQYAPGDRESVINVERIEVVKGPSGVLFGGGSGATAGGLINIVSKLPEPVRFAEGGVTAGSNTYLRPFFDVNQPITPNILARATGEFTYSESNVDVVETKRFNLNPTLMFTDGEATSVILQGRVSRWEQQEYQGLPATGTVAGDFRVGRDLFIGPDDIPDSDSNTASATARVEHRFNEIWSARAIGRYSDSDFREKVQTIFGSDGFVADAPFQEPSTWGLVNAELYQEQKEYSFAASTLGEFDLGPFANQLLLGGDYSHLDDEGFLQFTNPVGTVDLNDPSFDFPYEDPGDGENDLFVKNRTGGVYTQLQTSIWDRLHLLASVRYASVQVDYRNKSTGGSADTDETKLLPRLGAVFDVTDEVSVFAGYGQGIRGQPFLEYVGAPKPEESSQIEAGVKLDFGFGLSGTLAVFQIELENVPVTDTATFLSVADGKQRSRGFDADLVWAATPELSFLASYAYIDAEFTKDAPTFSGTIPKGNELPGVPKHAGRLWASYSFTQPQLEGLSLGAGFYAQTDEQVGDNNQFQSDAFYTVDATARYQTQRFRVELALRNLTDNDYFDRYNYFGGRVAPSPGRSAFVTVAATF